jgi:hypothetical protein
MIENNIFFYFFIFSILINFRYVWRFIISVISTPPKPLEMNEFDFYQIVITFSYIITYIFKH